MQGFCHRSEIFRHPARERCRNTHDVWDRRLRGLEQPRAGCRHRERPDGTRGMPAAESRDRGRRAGHPPANLGADDEGRQDFGRRRFLRFGNRQDGRDQPGNRLPDEIRQIVIHGVGGDAVGKRRELRRSAQRPPDDGRNRRATFELDQVADDVGGRVMAAGEHDTNGVDPRDARPFDDDRRNVLEIEIDNVIGDGLCRLNRSRVSRRRPRQLLGACHEWQCRRRASDKTDEFTPSHVRP